MSRRSTVLFALLGAPLATLAGCAPEPIAALRDGGLDGAVPASDASVDPPRDAWAAPVDAMAPMPDAPVAPACLEATEPCEEETQCCGALSCGTTSLGRVCCGETGETCDTPDGRDCCGALLCIAGRCALPTRECRSPCFAAPALALEADRLEEIGGSFLGICGDAAHTYGYHVPAARLPGSDYSMRGAANDPVCDWHACAIDIGMDWPAARDWLRWLIREIREDRIMGIAEVIGSYDGRNVRYWSDSSGWGTDGMAYTGSGHDTWAHVSIYRSTALVDHGILRGWTRTGRP